MSTSLYHCFATSNAKGADALVVEDTSLAHSKKLAFASEKNASAVVFYTRIKPAHYTLDFYYPHANSPLCLHAVLAAAKHLSNEDDEINMYTAQHNKKIVCSLKGNSIRAICMTPHELREYHDHDDVLKILGVVKTDLQYPPVLVDVGSKKLMIQLKEKNKILSIKPELKGLIKWGVDRNINGCFVFSEGINGYYFGRNFNHIKENVEDSATGVAALCIAAIKGKDITLFQGEHLNNRCRLKAGVTSDGLWIEGCVK